ncbi:MAG: 4-hydroxy-3-methylbut-2-enyl diphosphate reductase [Candidatus Moranbacteria bacterium CG_4_10_14_3_um_filter_45_9]|nr:MAG: 4-hydroxy-3-methylbut-2-enyl diphosphate reductase [Candidatus Moranbacteria bacterium CG2_30_45_14]PIX90388.1 MAG: 4-hydroxy-3-methylbut-2-enyl diphosphate reductase [Candidatus Moranbacteria bacterium CG_4_10_14_3_um_filter_45_9]PJA85835.1 MAG: 4-hydroxy-3-methylbut-2-enyl diphosphate reductase [Candidatus Moranbacteria bacterium CG_4_9_14_3_um_filter_45_14]
MHTVKKLLLATPRGFCAGVTRAVKAVLDTLQIFGAPVYVKHEIVHNKHVVEDLESKGIITIESLGEAPEGAVVVFSAHGSIPEHYREAQKRHIRLIDATCPLVTKVHLEVGRFLKEGYKIVYIGHRGHIEGLGVLGEATSESIPLVETTEDVSKLEIGNPEKLVYLTQTTLSIDDTAVVIKALKKKYPQIIAPPLSDICFATTNRQEAVKALAKASDLVLVLGSKNSSNSTRLMETARMEGTEAYLIDDVTEIDSLWLEQKETVGVSAGASAPEKLVQGVVEYFKSQGVIAKDFIVGSESIQFAEPLELMQLKREQK